VENLSQISQEIVAEQIVECIDQSLSDFEEERASIVYTTTKRWYGICKEQIPEKPEAFAKVLKGVFGADTDKIEKSMKGLIIERLHLRENLHYLTLPQLISEVVISANSMKESQVIEA
jgi:hypothetical protein